MSEARRAYDPIPDLAALLSAVRSLLRPGWRNRHGDMRAVLSGLELGAVGRLTRGLGLDEPGQQVAGTEAVIRGALTAYTTRTGKLITEDEIVGWVAEAEAGYDISQLTARKPSAATAGPWQAGYGDGFAGRFSPPAATEPGLTQLYYRQGHEDGDLDRRHFAERAELEDS